MHFTGSMRLAIFCAASIGCSRPGLPRHPVGELSARAEAKLELVDLVVSDPERAERVRSLYRRAFEIGHGFALERARALAEARRLATAREALPAARAGGNPGALEHVLAPPIGVGRRAYHEYTALMLEARTLLTRDEFERLDGVR